MTAFCDGRGFAEHQSKILGQSLKMLITLAPPELFQWFKYCIVMYFNIVQPLVSNTVTRLHQASFWPGELFW